MEKVIVVGGLHGALASIRALGSNGLYIISLTHNPHEFATASRYIKERAICPNPSNEAAVVDYLIQQAPRWQGAFILETTDAFSVILAKHRDELSPYYHFATPDWKFVNTFINKSDAAKLVADCGIPQPSLLQPQNLEELDVIAEQIIFPVIMKPVRSHEFVAHFRRKSFFANNMDELYQNFRRAQEAQQPLLLQEIIPGTDEGTIEIGFVYINSKDEMACELYGIKLRQGPPGFGVMRVGKSSHEPSVDLRELTRRLLNSIHYRGFADIEFKRDPRDNQLKFIEVNVRIPTGIQLMIAEGVNIPWMMYQDIVHNNQFAYDSITGGMYGIDILADIRGLLLSDKGIYNFKSYYQPYLAARKTFFVFSVTDPLPSLKRAFNLPAKTFSKLARGKKQTQRIV